MKLVTKKFTGFIVTTFFVFAQIVASFSLFEMCPCIIFLAFCILCLVGMSTLVFLVLEKLGFEKMGTEFVFLYGFEFYCLSYFAADFAAADGAEAVLSVFLLSLFVGLPSVILFLMLIHRQHSKMSRRSSLK